MMKKLTIITLSFFCLICMAMVDAAYSLDITPFDSFNQNPVVGIYGLPGPGNFLLLPERQTELALNVVLSSNYTVDDNAGEHFILDGETTRFTVAARHSLYPHLELGLKIPYVSHSGGFLDGFIESYHSIFGFPQGGRDQAPGNRLLYRYSRDGIERLRVDSANAGIGDLRLTTAFQLYEKREHNEGVALHASVKLPTGDSGQLRGSGSTDLALWVSGGTGGRLALGKWASYGSAGMLFMTEGDVLPEQQKKSAGFGTLGIGWAPLTWLALKVQADAHTPLFSGSDLKEIAANSVQLIVGGTVSFSERTMLDIGVAEDLLVGTAPDVSFYLTLRNQF